MVMNNYKYQNSTDMHVRHLKQHLCPDDMLNHPTKL